MNIVEFLYAFLPFKKQLSNHLARLREPEKSKQLDVSINAFLKTLPETLSIDAIKLVQQLCISTLTPEDIDPNPKLSRELKQNVPNATLDDLNLEAFEQVKALCEVAFQFENEGNADVHAYKLIRTLGDFNSVCNYLIKFYSSHKSALERSNILSEASSLNLPDNEISSEIWQQLAKNHLHDDRFRRLYPFAHHVEALIYKQQGTPELEKISIFKNRLGEIGRAWKNLNKHRSELTNAQIEEHDLLAQDYSSHLVKLAEAYAGTDFNARVPLQMLDAFFELYRIHEDPTYAQMIAKGITKPKFELFRSLEKIDNDELIPNITIDGKLLGLDGFYLRKIPVKDEDYAVVAATLGKDTDCCMSMTGEAGESCVIHGLTDPKSGFYILCYGNAENMLPSDPVLAQSWAWRPRIGKPSDTPIVFDSIEANKAFLENNARAYGIIKSFFYALTFKLITQQKTNKVTVGANSGIIFGYERCADFSALEVLSDYSGYTDALKQRVLATVLSPFMMMVEGTRPELNQIIEKWLTPLILRQSQQYQNIAQSHLLVSMMAFAIEHDHYRIFTLLKKILSPDQFESLKSQCNQYHKLISNSEPDFEKALDMIKHGQFINITNHYKRSLLLLAISKHRDDLVNILLEDKNLNLKIPDQFGETALTLAIKKRKPYVSKLIELGADINQPGIQGETAFMLACSLQDNSLFNQIFEQGNIYQVDEQRRHALFYAIHSRDPSRIEKLIKHGAKLNHLDLHGQTALAYCVSSGRIEMAKLLLKYEIDLNYKSKSGRSYLFMCADRGHEDLVNLLIAKGIGLNHTNEKSLHISIMKKHPKIALALIKNGANVNLKDRYGNTPLMLALRSRQFDVARALIEKGASPSICNKKSQCANDIAKRVNFNLEDASKQAPKKQIFTKSDAPKSMSERFVDAVYEKNIRKALALSRNDEGMLISHEGKLITPLSYVCLNSSVDMIRAICSVGDVNGFDPSGWHVLQHVMLSDHQNTIAIIAVLLEEGANIHARSQKHESPLATANRLKKEGWLSYEFHGIKSRKSNQ